MRLTALWLVLLCAACHSGGLTVVAGALRFSAPDDPAALAQPDAGLVLVDFGTVTIDSTRALTVDLTSLAGQVTLGSVTPVQPDPEFALPFVPGSVVGTTPSAVTMSFSPTSLGSKNASFALTDFSPGAATVLIQVTGQGVADGLSVSPNPLDFGRVELDQTQTASLTVTNQGSLPATLTVSPLMGADAALFTLGAPAATVLAPGASTTLSATFAPLVVAKTGQQASASFAIDGWPTTDPITVNLTGTGVVTWLEITPLLNFNYVQVDHVFVKSAVLTNLSSFATLHLVPPVPAVTGAEFSLQSFSPASIAPGESRSIPVAFSPYGTGLATGSLTLNTDDPLAQHPVVPLEGYGGGPSIFCYPRLSFAPTLVGTAQTLQAICLNAGTVIPGHPELTLQFSEGDITTDNPIFTAALWTPDGGPPPADAGVSLPPGSSAFINVTFSPSDAGPVFGKLTVASNDLNDVDAGTILLGDGMAPGPCSLQVMPSELSFGEVPKGDVGKMQFQLVNVGQDYCAVTDVGLDSTTDAAFSLPVGLKAPQLLSFVGNTGFPQGLPTSILLEAQFAPTISKAVSVGAVDVMAFDTSNLAIPLTGTSLAGCLSIQPPSFDFGLLGFSSAPPPYPGSLCASANKVFTAANSCAQPLTLTQISLAPGAYADPQFSVGAGPPLPFVLAPGEQTAFVAGFTPTMAGPNVGDILVTSSDLPQTPYLVTLEGDPEVTGTRTDTFTFPAPPKKVDLAVILDNDDDYWTSTVYLASVLPKLVDALNQSQIDYRIAVTSTDTCDAGASDQGSFEPCDHCLSTAQSNPIFVTPETTPDPATELGNLFGLFAAPVQSRDYCSIQIGDEHLFDAIADVFSPALLGGHNSGFIRPDAYLAILMANGDDEDDANHSGPAFEYRTALPAAISLVESLKPDPSQVSFSYVYEGNTAGVADLPRKMGELVQATGGLAINGADPNWQSQLVNLFAFGGEGQAFFTLASTPADPKKIQVKVNGVATTNWALVGNQLYLTGTPLPAPGSIVTATYQVGC